jgi:hypothetical protein
MWKGKGGVPPQAQPVAPGSVARRTVKLLNSLPSERRISAKNEIIITSLRLGKDTVAEEAQVGEMSTALQNMQGVRRTLVAGLRARALSRRGSAQRQPFRQG